WRFRTQLRVAAASRRPDLGTDGADLAVDVFGAAGDLGRGPAGGRVLGSEEIFDCRLRGDVRVVRRAGHSQLPAGAGADVCRRGQVRTERRWPVFRAVPDRAVERGEDDRPAATPVDPG